MAVHEYFAKKNLLCSVSCNGEFNGGSCHWCRSRRWPTNSWGIFRSKITGSQDARFYVKGQLVLSYSRILVVLLSAKTRILTFLAVYKGV